MTVLDPGMHPRGRAHVNWLMLLAFEAGRFFSRDNHAQILAEFGKPDPAGSMLPFTMNDFLQYLQPRGFPWIQAQGLEVQRLLNRMVDARMLTDHGQQPGYDIWGHRYFTDQHQLSTQSQSKGFLWLSEPLGAELIKPSYGSVTVAVAGYDENGDEHNGSGLVLDSSHILTNAHVVNDLKLKDEIEHSSVMPPGLTRLKMNSGARVLSYQAHPSIDVAIITVDKIMGKYGLPPLNGVAFRPPEWSDETYVFGYPPIAQTTSAHLTSEHGEVVNPSITDYLGQEYFVYSATTRPGNSGGPIVAQDGRVIGIVAHDVIDEGRPDLAHYRGLPGHVVVDALKSMGFGNLAILEDWT